MRISEVLLSSLEIPMKRTFATSRAKQDVAKHVIVQLFSDDGLVGIGEGAPRPHISGETVESAFLLIEKYLAPLLVGKDPTDIAAIHREMDRIIELNPAAKCAIDLALYDLLGKRFGVPVYELLGGRTKDSLHINGTCDIQAPGLVSEALRRILKDGFRYSIKIKIGTDPATDVERVRLAREAIGQGIDLIADANQGWDVATAIRVLRKIDDFDLQVAEQPVYWRDLSGMAQVTSAVRSSVMADESVWSSHDAMQIIQMKAARMLNIKLIKTGGLHDAHKIATMAQGANMRCMVGCTLETSILCAAQAHLAMASENIVYIDSLTPGEFLAEDPAQGLNWTGDLVVLPDKPGLGVELKEATMSKYTTRRSSIKKP
jgi:L-alanine-DL-glutamate epimerase-like enolase superfamily enzyme